MTENRKIKDTAGIPLENIVVSEMPVTKAAPIGQLASRGAADGK